MQKNKALSASGDGHSCRARHDHDVAGGRSAVLRLTQRLPEGKVLSEAEMVAVPYELAWLERLA